MAGTAVARVGISPSFFASPQLVALAFGRAAPDPVQLARAQREHQALGLYRAAGADGFGLDYLIEARPSGGDREEQVGVGGLAGRSRLPCPFIVIRAVPRWLRAPGLRYGGRFRRPAPAGWAIAGVSRIRPHTGLLTAQSLDTHSASRLAG